MDDAEMIQGVIKLLDRRKRLEADMLNLILAFEKETGLRTGHISTRFITFENGKEKTVNVNVDVRV